MALLCRRTSLTVSPEKAGKPRNAIPQLPGSHGSVTLRQSPNHRLAASYSLPGSPLDRNRPTGATRICPVAFLPLQLLSLAKLRGSPLARAAHKLPQKTHDSHNTLRRRETPANVPLSRARAATPRDSSQPLHVSHCLPASYTHNAGRQRSTEPSLEPLKASRSPSPSQSRLSLSNASIGRGNAATLVDRPPAARALPSTSSSSYAKPISIALGFRKVCAMGTKKRLRRLTNRVLCGPRRVPARH